MAQSLTAAIYRYKGDWNTYLADCMDASEKGESDNLPLSYEPAMQVLDTWDRPAESIVEAMLALELAVEDFDAGDTPRIPAMMNAALRWIQVEQKRRACKC